MSARNDRAGVDLRIIRRRTILLVTALLVLVALPGAAAASTDMLRTYGTLRAGQDIVSPDGHYELVMQPDGELVEYIAGGRPLWRTPTLGDNGSHVVMQPGGNLVIYNPAGAAVWSSNSSGTGCPSLVIQNTGNTIIYSPGAIWTTQTRQTTMLARDVLRPGWSIYSPNDHYQLIMQPAGNLALYDGDGKTLWSSGTGGHPGAYAVLNAGGNLVVYPPSGAALWSTNISRDSGAHLSLQSDGNLVLYKGSTAVWSTKTAGQGSRGSLAPKPPAPVTSCPPPAPPAPPPPPPPVVPVLTTPVSTPIAPPPQPTPPHALTVKLRISWTWNHAATRLVQAKIGHFPGKSQLVVQCGGRGCPGKRTMSAHGFWKVLGLLHKLKGKRYHAGDRVRITLTAPGYLPERALVEIRNGRLPGVMLLSR